MHYGRFRKHGSPFAERMHYKKGTISSGDGYKIVYVANHPLASSKGMVAEHRVILYGKIGPGEHECSYCDKIVSWETKTLFTDHVDHDRENNSLDNLVPTCKSCNSKRQKYGKVSIDIERDVEWKAKILKLQSDL